MSIEMKMTARCFFERLLEVSRLDTGYDEYDARTLKDDLRETAKWYQSPEPFEIFCGASKMCIVPKNLPFVFKWSYPNEDWDEAADESRLYQEAKALGIECFFPETEFFILSHDVQVFVQKKVPYNSDNLPSCIQRRFSKIVRNCNASISSRARTGMTINRPVDTLWIKMCLTICGKRKTYQLEKFIQSNGINDLHYGNIGYIGTQPVILDFSGFHRES